VNIDAQVITDAIRAARPVVNVTNHIVRMQVDDPKFPRDGQPLPDEQAAEAPEEPTDAEVDESTEDDPDTDGGT
jgi:hypothetical protein